VIATARIDTWRRTKRDVGRDELVRALRQLPAGQDTP
jgi:hypothetical protein